MKKFLKKHKVLVIILAVVIVLAIVAAIVVPRVLRRNRSANLEITQDLTYSLTKQDLITSISASGTIEAGDSENVSADVTDIEIASVEVSVGDTVSKGDTVVTFDESDLEEALEEAQENYSDVVSSCNKSVSKAEDTLSDAKSNYSETKSELAEAVQEAKESVSEIRSQIKALKKKIKKATDSQTKSSLNEQLTQLQEQLTQAKETLTQAKENQETTNEQNLDTIEQAEDSLEEAEDNSTSSIKTAKKQVTEAQEALDACEAVAGISGVVTAVSVEEGDKYSGGTIVTIENTDSYTITTSVDEYDISDVEVGQRVVIKTEATDDDELEGEITFVAPSTSSTSSTSSDTMTASSSGYEVIVEITTSDDRLKMGLTAKCSIVLEEADDVFAVPYDCIHENSDGESVIYVKDGDDQTEIVVETGMETDYYTEISSDELEEGLSVVMPSDSISVSSDSDDSSDFASMMSGGGFSGGGDSVGGGNMGGGMPSGGGPG